MKDSILTAAGSIRHASLSRKVLEVPLLGEAAKSTFWRAMLLLSNGVVERGVDQTRARFTVETVYDCRYLSDLGGEKTVLSDLLDRLEPNDVFWDVGSYHGIYSVLAGTANPQLDIVAFEPHPIAADRLAENADLNDIDVHLVRKALSNKEGRAYLAPLDEEMEALQGLFPEPVDDGTPVPTIRGDRVAGDSAPGPTVLKIDAEGHEGPILDGLQNSLSRSTCRLIYVELHPQSTDETEQDRIEARLRAAGFQVEEFFSRTKNAEKQPFLRGVKAAE